MGSTAHQRSRRGRGSSCGAGEDRGGDSQALPQGADYRARGQRLLPRGHHGVVRGAAAGGLLLPGISQELHADREVGAGVSRCTGASLSDGRFERADVR